MRLATIQLLESLLLSSSSSSSSSSELDHTVDPFLTSPDRALLDLMRKVEEAPMDAASGRVRVQKLQQLSSAIEYNKISQKFFPLVFPFLIGQYKCRFTLPWPSIK
eukprot:754517-Hanusia_phi.AAC.1